jgi:uncharacterized LabA/DUF88 family protein
MSSQPASGFAAVFIDFENIFYHLKGAYADLPDLNDYIFNILRNLRSRLEQEQGLRPIIIKAYADFERMKSTPQGSLYLMGIETHNVLGTDHKNSADMKLCIDAMEILYTRPEIETFIFLAGDRDYIPVIQHLKKQARSVRAVAFSGHMSGDLLMIVGAENVIDAMTLLEPAMIARLEEMAIRQRQIEESYRERDRQRQLDEIRAAESVPTPARDTMPGEGDPGPEPLAVKFPGRKSLPDEPSFGPVAPITSEHEQICLEVLLGNYSHHHEIWVSPFLRKLSDALPALADFERKALVTMLESAGAIRIEKRRGEPYDYSILLINYNHPAVRRLNPG